MLEAKMLQLETEGVTVRESAFNFNTESVTRGSPAVLKRGRLIDSSRSRPTSSLSTDPSVQDLID